MEWPNDKSFDEIFLEAWKEAHEEYVEPLGVPTRSVCLMPTLAVFVWGIVFAVLRCLGVIDWAWTTIVAPPVLAHVAGNIGLMLCWRFGWKIRLPARLNNTPGEILVHGTGMMAGSAMVSTAIWVFDLESSWQFAALPVVASAVVCFPLMGLAIWALVDP